MYVVIIVTDFNFIIKISGEKVLIALSSFFTLGSGQEMDICL